MSRYVPDRWLLTKIANGKGDVAYKIFASWYGGYLGADSWKLNSGIVKVIEEENSYLFYGYTGSIYECHKGSYGISGYGSSVLANMIDQAQQIGGSIEVLPDDTNPMVLKYNQETSMGIKHDVI